MTTIERINELLSRKGIKPSKMMKDLGFSSGLFSQWKSGMQKPSADKLGKIAEYLETTTDYLLGKTDSPAVSAHEVTDDDIKFALFGGDGEVTDEMYEEIKAFAEFVKNKHKNKKD